MDKFEIWPKYGQVEIWPASDLAEEDASVILLESRDEWLLSRQQHNNTGVGIRIENFVLCRCSLYRVFCDTPNGMASKIVETQVPITKFRTFGE